MHGCGVGFVDPYILFGHLINCSITSMFISSRFMVVAVPETLNRYFSLSFFINTCIHRNCKLVLSQILSSVLGKCYGLQPSLISALNRWWRHVNPGGQPQTFCCIGVAQNCLLEPWFSHSATIVHIVIRNIQIISTNCFFTINFLYFV